MKRKENPIKLDFVGIGFQKCGTSSLFDYLFQFPEIFMPKQKELHYFCNHPIKDGHISIEKEFENSKSNQLLGEFTPCYIASEKSISSIYKHNPNIKLIVIMRNPVERFISAFHHARDSKAIPKKLSPEMIIKHESLFAFKEYPWISNMVSQGKYIKFINVLLDYFPMKNIQLLFLEDFINKSVKPSDVLNFIRKPGKKVDVNSTNEQLPKSNDRELFKPLHESQHIYKLNGMEKTFYRINKKHWMGDTLEQRMNLALQNHYEESNSQLSEFLGRELPW